MTVLVRFALVALLAAAPAAAGGSLPRAPGTWTRLPAAPIRLLDEHPVSVLTGHRLIVFGRVTTSSGVETSRVHVAAAYDPAAAKWTELPSPPAWADGIYGYSAVWTGKEMLVWGQGLRAAFDPATNRWRPLPDAPALDGAATVVWTGRELIGWGGGCCGEAWADGVAYNPSTNSWRKLPRSPVHGDQNPVGAWTGRQLILLVSGVNPSNGKPWPARFARAAAYNPSTNRWHRIAPPPASRGGATAVWDGREVLLIGGAPGPRGGKPAALARQGFAYNPKRNRWRRLAPMPSGRAGFTAQWTGTRLLIWGGTTNATGRPQSPARGLAYDPSTNRWSALPQAPLRGRLDPTSVWTGHALIVWSGGTGRPPYRAFTDGAIFTPRAS